MPTNIWLEMLKAVERWNKLCLAQCSKIHMSCDEDLRMKLMEEYMHCYSNGEARCMWLELEAATSMDAGRIDATEPNVMQLAHVRRGYARLEQDNGESLIDLLSKLQ